MVVTEVSSQSWFSRIGDSIKSFLFGIALFVASFVVLWLNEGRAVRTEKGLHEGQGAVVEAPADRVDTSLNQKLVHVSARATTDEQLTDPDFLIAANAIKLRRKVEMYQWKEKKESETKKKLGGGSETRTTYSYEKTWDDDKIDSSGFKEAGHDNPAAKPFESRETLAGHVAFGAYTLSPSLVAKMDDYQPVPVSEQQLAKLPAEASAKLKVRDNAFYVGSDPASPQIGDARVTFSVISPAEVSVVAKQAGTSFEPYRASSGLEIEMLKRGVVGAQAMFDVALKQNTVFTWVLRVVGFILMFIGLALFFKPISVLGDVVPFFGSMLAFGTGLFAFVIAAVLSVGTIAVAWIFYRPFLGIALLAIAIAILVWFAVQAKKKLAAGAPQPVTVT